MSLDWYNEFKRQREGMVALAHAITSQTNQENGIYYETNVSFYGAHFVIFNIRGKRWAYRLSFPDWVDKVRLIAAKSPGKALAFAKKHKSTAYEVTRDFPAPGSIIREEGEQEEEPEPEVKKTPEVLEQTTFDLD